jgi:hypothetical protein
MTNWMKLCEGEKTISINRNRVRVQLGEHRHHYVEIRDAGDVLELRAIVARRREIREIDDISLRAWFRNRGTQLLGFKVDKQGHLVGEAWIPKVGLTKEELHLYIKKMALECDRFEYLLTGTDRE